MIFRFCALINYTKSTILISTENIEETLGIIRCVAQAPKNSLLSGIGEGQALQI